MASSPLSLLLLLLLAFVQFSEKNEGERRGNIRVRGLAVEFRCSASKLSYGERSIVVLFFPSLKKKKKSLYVIYIYIYIIYVCMYVRVYVCICICIYIHICACFVRRSS